MYSQQMQRFEDGGLKDEGGMVDEVSGNDVPVGSTRKEVRDDVPAMLSEGEFVFPADVVRFIGLEELMRMRQEAKMGLKQMEAMGQMGNSEEATMPDDMPFNEADLIILAGEPEMGKREMNRGGVIHAQQGAFVPNTPEQQQQSGIAGFQQSMYADRAPINPYQYTPPASAFSPADVQQGTQTSGYRPKFVDEGVGRRTPIDRSVTSQDFVQQVFRDVQYINPTTGDIIDVRFLGDTPIAGIPDGYIPLSEYTGSTGGTGGGGGTGTTGTTDTTDTTATTAQVASSDDDGGPDIPTPEPFDWDNADPDAIINEIGKINGGAGSIITGIGFLIGGPAFGMIANTMVKANEKQTFEKLTAKLKDPEFVAKMRKAGKLEELKTQLEALEEKAKKGGTLGVGILSMLTDTIKKIGGAMGATEEEQKTALKGSIDAETGKDGSKDGTDAEDKGTNVLTVSQLKGEFSRGEKTAKGAEIPTDYTDRIMANRNNMTLEEYMYQKESGTGIFATDSAIDSVNAASDEDAPTVAKAKADLAANSLKTRGVTADTISEAEFSKVKDSPDALLMLGIDPRTTNYQELKRNQQQQTTATETGVEEVVGEAVEEGDETGTGTTLVRDETGEALGTTVVDVQTMTTDELSEVMMGLDTPQLMSLSQLTMAGISARGALEYFVNGDAQALAKEIADKQQTNIISQLDDNTSTAIQTALTTTRTRTLAGGDDTPTATDIQNYLNQVAGETSTTTTTPSVSRPSVSSPTPTYTQPASDPYAETGRPTSTTTTTSTSTPTYTQPSSDPYAETDRPTSTTTSTSTSTPVIPTGSSGMPSLDAYVSTVSSNNNDDDPPSFAPTSTNNNNDKDDTPSWSSSDETNVGSAVGSGSGGSGSLVTGVATSEDKMASDAGSVKKSDGSFDISSWFGNEGGLVSKPVKKKRATKKKRGVAARKN